MIERTVDVGDRVSKGEVLARLDPATQQADVASAEAGVAAAEATLAQVKVTFDRQSALLRTGNTTRATYEDAAEALQSATAALDSARADLGVARENLATTELRAETPGVITQRAVEAGQVVEAAQTVFTLAQDGGRDAVFDVYEALLARPPVDDKVEVVLLSDSSMRVSGRIREVSPVVDPTTGSVRIKIELPQELPAAMTLGAPVAAIAAFDAGEAVALPWTALTDVGGPAVFVVDRADSATPRKVGIAGYRTGVVLIGYGLSGGETVVNAGAQFLRAGEVVDPRS